MARNNKNQNYFIEPVEEQDDDLLIKVTDKTWEDAESGRLTNEQLDKINRKIDGKMNLFIGGEGTLYRSGYFYSTWLSPYGKELEGMDLGKLYNDYHDMLRECKQMGIEPVHNTFKSYLLAELANSRADSQEYDEVYRLVNDITRELNEHEDDFTLAVTDKIWHKVERMKLNPEQEYAVRAVMSAFMDKQAEKIFDNEVKRYPGGYLLRDRITGLFAKELDSNEFAKYYKDYRDMVSDCKDTGKNPKYSTFESYLSPILNNKWKSDIEERKDELTDEIFMQHLSDDEKMIISNYLKNYSSNAADELRARGFKGVQGLKAEFKKGHILKLTLKTENEIKYNRDSISQMFGNGDIYSLSKNLSEMSTAEQIRHFDNALYHVMYCQGYSIKELAKACLTKTSAKGKFLKSASEAINNLKGDTEPELSMYVLATNRNLDVLDYIAKKSRIPLFTQKRPRLELQGRSADNAASVIELDKTMVIDADIVSDVQVLENVPFERSQVGHITAQSNLTHDLFNVRGRLVRDTADAVEYINVLKDDLIKDEHTLMSQDDVEIDVLRDISDPGHRMSDAAQHTDISKLTVDKQVEWILDDEIRKNPNGYNYRSNTAQLMEIKTNGEEFSAIYADYCDMLRKCEKNKVFPEYYSLEAYAIDKVREQWEPYADKQIEKNFKRNRTDAEYKMVNMYLDGNGKSIGEALRDRGFAGLYKCRYKFSEDLALRLTIKTSNELESSGSISEMFGSGDIKDLKEQLSHMSMSKKLKHFDNALVYLMHKQGHSLTELTKEYFAGNDIKNDFVESAAKALAEVHNIPSIELSVYGKISFHSIEVLDRIAKGSDERFRVIDDPMVVLSDGTSDGKQAVIKLEKPLSIEANMISDVQFLDTLPFDRSLLGRVSDLYYGKDDKLDILYNIAEDVLLTTDYIKDPRKHDIVMEKTSEDTAIAEKSAAAKKYEDPDRIKEQAEHEKQNEADRSELDDIIKQVSPEDKAQNIETEKEEAKETRKREYSLSDPPFVSSMYKEAMDILDDEVRRYPNGYNTNQTFYGKVDVETYEDIFENYRLMVNYHQQTGTEPEYDTFEAYLNDVLWAENNASKLEAELIGATFNEHRNQKERRLVNEYIEARNTTISDELKDRDFRGTDFNVKLGETLKIVLFLATELEKASGSTSISDMFYNGDIETINENLSEMSKEEQVMHFDNALTYLMEEQGHSIKELAQGYSDSSKIKSDLVKSAVNELKNIKSTSAVNLTAYTAIDKNNLDVLDKIAKCSDELITLPTETGIGISIDKAYIGQTAQLEKPLTVKANMVSDVRVYDVIKDDGRPMVYTQTADGRFDSASAEKRLKQDVKQTVEHFKKLNSTKDKTDKQRD